ncbi:CTNA1 protein, partial [Atlantisia rogersi]|nr:CTNA1 protein [Atlantisia rogersi]
IQAASWLLECLSVLRDAGGRPGVLAAFRAVSQALLLLSSLTAQRLQELRDCPLQRSLAHTLQLLQKCVPLLHRAKHSQLKRSHSQHGTLASDHAFQLMEGTIRELTSLLMESTGSREPGDRGGTFSQHVSRLLALLSHPDPANLSDTELSAHTEAIIFHCMLLADSSRSDLRLDLVRRCRVLLQLRKSICGHVSQREREGWSGPSWGEGSLEQECRTMREEVEDLDRAALTATLCQVLDTFVEGTEPLRRLVEGALSLAGTGSFPEGQGGFLKQLQPLTTTFFTHAQQTLRAADFVLARCTNPQTAGEIGEQAECLRRLLVRLPALLTGRSGDAAGERSGEQLRSLSHTWAVTTARLLRCFEATVSMPELLQLSLQEMAGHREGWERALERQDAEGLSWHAARLTAWAQWMVGATTRHVDRATDPIFRNGLLVWVEQLAHSILELKAVAALPPERLSQLQSRDDISKVVSCLMDAARCVQEGLDGSNHPDILSPLRARVRSAAVAQDLGLSLSHAGLETITNGAAVQEDVLGHPSPRAGNSQPGVVPGKGDTHPIVIALLAATSAHDTAAIDSACSALLELSHGCVAAAREALPVADPPQAEALGQHQEIVLMTGALVSLARDMAPQQPHRPGSLLPTAHSLSERLRETTECLAAVAGSWYSLAQQVFGFISSADFLRGKEALDETMAGLAGAVQLAGDIASTAWSEGNPLSSETWESFLQVQAKFSRAQVNTKVLLEKAVSFKGSCQTGEASLELHCVQWAVSTHVLLCAMDQFIGRDILLLRELRSAVKNKLCWRSLLAAVSENSLRLQEAARLSYLSCPEDSSCSEILALREEIKVLMEALLEASSALWVSPQPGPSLRVRFELLQRELALRAKALLLHLERVNTQHLRVIRDVLGPALSPLSQEGRERSREAFEEKAGQLMANVQWVKSTLQDVLEASTQLPSPANLLSIAEHLLVLTSDAVGTASQLLQSHQDKGHLHLDSTVCYWSAAAHYLVRQLGAAQGISPHVLQLITQRLQNARDQRSPSSPIKPSPAPDTPGHPKSAGTSQSRTGQAGRAAREACEMVW